MTRSFEINCCFSFKFEKIIENTNKMLPGTLQNSPSLMGPVSDMKKNGQRGVTGTHSMQAVEANENIHLPERNKNLKSVSEQNDSIFRECRRGI